jgi:hypothetical protein
MEADYQLYLLAEVEDDGNPGRDFEVYTSNAPQTFADKVISWLNSHMVNVRVPYGLKATKEERAARNDKERVIRGLLNAADERLMLQGQLTLQEQLDFFISLRGWCAGRSLLMKRDGNTYVDVTPWDPMHVTASWGVDGLKWICHKIAMSPTQIMDAYPGFKLDDIPEDDVNLGIAVYDYYDETFNAVVVQDRFSKKPTPHGAERTPGFFVASGTAPPIQSMNLQKDAGEYGESVFKAVRGINTRVNKYMSIMAELVQRARNASYTYESRDGSKTLDADPFISGSEIPLAQGERITPLGLMEMARETAPFMAMVSGEWQRGTVPFSVYGELPFQLSGFAITTLRQGIDTVLEPRLKALRSAYTQIINLLIDQYVSGRFTAMELSGQDRNRHWFSETIEGEGIKGLPVPKITLLGKLPQDDAVKMQMAQFARQGPVPLLPDQVILDDILGVEDSDMVDAAIKEQIGERLLPEAAIWNILVGLMDRGRDDLAQFYIGKLMEMQLAKQMAISQGQAPTDGQPGPSLAGGQGSQNASSPQGFSPEVLPNAAQGKPPPTPTPQAGPIVPPGTPRPGARG